MWTTPSFLNVQQLGHSGAHNLTFIVFFLFILDATRLPFRLGLILSEQCNTITREHETRKWKP